MTPEPADTYHLGNDAQALVHQESQSAALVDATRTILGMAGISSGMRVLDLGCGPGTSSLLVADLVGPTGYVVGMDSSLEPLEWARAKARERGYQSVQFVEGDVQDGPPDGDFDAVVGRNVLMHVPDPLKVVRTQAEALRPEALMVLMEYGGSTIDTLGAFPPTPLMTQVCRWIAMTSEALGIHADIGKSLSAILRGSGMVPLGTIGIQPHFLPDDPAAASAWFNAMRAVAPLAVKTGGATPEEIAIDTLEDRLRDEVRNARAIVAIPMLMGAWARKQ